QLVCFSIPLQLLFLTLHLSTSVHFLSFFQTFPFSLSLYSIYPEPLLFTLHFSFRSSFFPSFLHFMHWYFLQEMHILVTVHEMPCIVIPSFLILHLIIILCTKLLRLIQLEPLNLKTSFKLWRVGLVKDTY